MQRAQAASLRGVGTASRRLEHDYCTFLIHTRLYSLLWYRSRDGAAGQGGADTLLTKQSDLKRTKHTLEQTLGDLQAKYMYGIGTCKRTHG
jgi:hypothetical protein